MTTKDKLEHIEGFEKAYDGIARLIAVLPDEALTFLPPVPDAWSINDHLVHLLDADTAICFRLRAAIAQPGFQVPVWDEEEWHGRLHYEAQSGRTAFGLALGLRLQTTASLRACVGMDWNDFHVHHQVRGKQGLVDLLTIYRDHGKTHEVFIKRNKEAWEMVRR